VAGGRARSERLTIHRTVPTWIVWLFRAALPVGVVWLILTVVYFVLYPPNQPFYVVQAVLAVLTAVYLIWLGWQWRNGDPRANG